MIKRCFALALVIVLVIPFFAFSEGNDAIFNELGNYLLYVDRLLEDENFALHYIEKFSETRTHDDLLIARAAIQSALREIENMEVPQMSMTEDEYFSYMLAGAEVEALALLYEEFEVLRNEKIYRLKGMHKTMLTDVYFEPALENLMKEVPLVRLHNQYYARDMAYMTNYLLIQLKDGGKIDAFWDVIRESTVIMKNEMDVFYTDLDEISDLTGKNLDNIGANIDKMEVLSGFSEYLLDLTLDAIGKNDRSVFKNNRTEIIGEPEVFPMPEWCLPTDMKYTYTFSDPETGDLYVHRMGNEISIAPYQIKVMVSDVTINDIQIYLDSLVLLEYNPYYEFLEDTDEVMLYLSAEKNGGLIEMFWSEEETKLFFLAQSASLVPYMYWK